MDYRDQLGGLFRELHDREGLSRFRISQRAGISEQTISNVLSKRRNLSAKSLERVLHRLGYELRYEPVREVTPGTGDAPHADRELLPLDR
ncbi:MAG: helix-turn-helix transcriptional regulator [Bacteroidota bacterium]|nr:helix-turn-helix transcriptional regulator [Bacteroidota bacterium]MDP4231843.1 helix-turn-helix transcriptional regulator [Bacteroidota bacterium]MDP4242729.1 helix-turn-helix transcriptional regulator [Bacteroidota bacterium]MDP4287180.1 helix-turn-helix transcriptional regulator [Bacteroidota bacterium]